MATKIAKKEVVITTKNLENVLDGEFKSLKCCAFLEYSGLENVKTLEDAVALRRAGSGDLIGHQDWHGDDLEVVSEGSDGIDHNGALLVTTIPSQARIYPLLEGAGFKKLGTFKGNTHNQVTLWGAQVLQPGKVEPKETRELVVLG